MSACGNGKMEHFYVITNGHKDCGLKKTNYIKDYLQRNHKKCTVQVKGIGQGEQPMGFVQEDTDPSRCFTDSSEIPPDTDCILVLGGDGTLLEAARDTINRDIPLLGINLGSLGFLAEVEVNGVDAALDQLIEDRYEVEQRMMLTGRIVRGSYHKKRHEEKGISKTGTKEFHALNDITVTRSGSLQIIRFQVFVNGQFLNEYHADGVIVATPTGSTGYNLSAGGPIVEPKAELLVMTPICPHTLNTRSIILSPQDRIELQIGTGREDSIQQVEVNFDGSRKLLLYTGDKVEIERAVMTTGIIKLNRVSFLEVLHKKMSET